MADPARRSVRLRRGAVAEGQGALYRSLRTATQFARIMGVSQRSISRDRCNVGSISCLLVEICDRMNY